MAEGEFALIREYGEAGIIRPSKGWATFGDHDLYSLLVDVAVKQRDETTLRQYIPLAEETAMRYDHRLYQAIAQRANGVLLRLVNNYGASELQLQQALNAFSVLNANYQIGRTFVELGELAISQSETSKAYDYFVQALNKFESLQAKVDMANVQFVLEKMK